MTKPRPPRQGIHVRMNDDLRARVVAEAEARGVSASWFIERLVTEGLERLIPSDEFTLTVEVTPRSAQQLGVDVLGPDGTRIEFFRVEPGAGGSVTIEGNAGDTFRLIMTESRATYSVTIEP